MSFTHLSEDIVREIARRCLDVFNKEAALYTGLDSYTSSPSPPSLTSSNSSTVTSTSTGIGVALRTRKGIWCMNRRSIGALTCVNKRCREALSSILMSVVVVRGRVGVGGHNFRDGGGGGGGSSMRESVDSFLRMLESRPRLASLIKYVHSALYFFFVIEETLNCSLA